MDAKILSIAGFDPCGGAGILADIKVFQALQMSCLGVTTCITYQNHQTISGIKWFSGKEILNQIKPLLQKYEIATIKISLIPNVDILEDILELFQKKSPKSILIWDPVYQASSGFSFYSVKEYRKFKKILSLIDVLTPNANEFKIWFSSLDLKSLQDFDNINWIIKSYEKTKKTVSDLIWFEKKAILKTKFLLNATDKHGTGCTLSSALAVYLAQGFSFLDAYQKANIFFSSFLMSTNDPLGKYTKN